jgi:hypothetical protein
MDGRVRYDIQVRPTTGYHPVCAHLSTLGSGQTVLVVVAAYLDGMLQARTIAPLQSVDAATCAKGLAIERSAKAPVQAAARQGSDTSQPADPRTGVAQVP